MITAIIGKVVLLYQNTPFIHTKREVKKSFWSRRNGHRHEGGGQKFITCIFTQRWKLTQYMKGAQKQNLSGREEKECTGMCGFVWIVEEEKQRSEEAKM